MILADTSVWISHFRAWDPRLSALLEAARVLGHPWVRGEIALGSLSNRHEVLELLAALPQAQVATNSEVMGLIESRHLFGRGIGYIDAHLLAATLLTAGAALWTLDQRLAAAAKALGVSSKQPAR